MYLLRTDSAGRVTSSCSRRSNRATVRAALVLIFLLIPVSFLRASDHADPIDPLNKEPLEGGITDLFVFPVLGDGRVAFPFQRSDKITLERQATPDFPPQLTPEERKQIAGIAVILCVRRALTDRTTLKLEPYTYRIHMDFEQAIALAGVPPPRSANSSGPGSGYQPAPQTPLKEISAEEARARYGGKVERPESIRNDAEIAITLKGMGEFNSIQIGGFEKLEYVRTARYQPDKICLFTGVRDDPFIFPAFFGTNVVAMVLTIPMDYLRPKNDFLLVWATSHRGTRQVDHVGRSLRTQNPRFELLNTEEPKEHVAVLKAAEKDPTLVRDILLRLNFRQTFAYRYWDFAPDVMVYSLNHRVGFPNGRLLYDDVAAELAQFGDTLLLELSYEHAKGSWPRRTTNDMPFRGTTEDKPELAVFPYLADPWPESPQAPGPALTPASQYKLALIAVGTIVVLALTHLLVARWYYRRKTRRRYL